MPQITLRGYVKDDEGNGIANVRVRAYAIQLDGTKAASYTTEDNTTQPDGKWEMFPDTDLSPTGLFAVEIYNPASGEVRWREPDVGVQIEGLVGAHGVAPIPADSINGFHVQDLSLNGNHIADASIPAIKLAGGLPYVENFLDSINRMFVGDTWTGDPEPGDIWFHTTGSEANHSILLWNGSAWEVLARNNVFDTSGLVNSDQVSEIVVSTVEPPVGDYQIGDLWIGFNDADGVYLNRGTFWELVTGSGSGGGLSLNTSVTVVDSFDPALGDDTHSLQNLLNAIVTRITRITGESDWTRGPDTTLADLAGSGGGSGAASSLNLSSTEYEEATLPSNDFLTGSYQDVLTLTLAAGTWMIWATAKWQETSDTGLTEIRLNGSGLGQEAGSVTDWGSASLVELTNLSATSNIALQAREVNGQGYLSKAKLIALRIS